MYGILCQDDLLANVLPIIAFGLCSLCFIEGHSSYDLNFIFPFNNNIETPYNPPRMQMPIMKTTHPDIIILLKIELFLCQKKTVKISHPFNFHFFIYVSHLLTSLIITDKHQKPNMPVYFRLRATFSR